MGARLTDALYPFLSAGAQTLPIRQIESGSGAPTRAMLPVMMTAWTLLADRERVAGTRERGAMSVMYSNMWLANSYSHSVRHFPYLTLPFTLAVPQLR